MFFLMYKISMKLNFLQNFFKNPRSWHLFLGIFFIIFAIIATFFENNFTENSSQTEISQTENSYIETIQGETREKVLKILDDAEVKKTLERIQKDEGFYNKDGAVFMNREKLLPVKSDKSYYSEWTVKTPWEGDRGARRIVEGKGGELYFTDDHYKNFIRIR